MGIRVEDEEEKVIGVIVSTKRYSDFDVAPEGIAMTHI